MRCLRWNGLISMKKLHFFLRSVTAAFLGCLQIMSSDLMKPSSTETVYCHPLPKLREKQNKDLAKSRNAIIGSKEIYESRCLVECWRLLVSLKYANMCPSIRIFHPRLPSDMRGSWSWRSSTNLCSASVIQIDIKSRNRTHGLLMDWILWYHYILPFSRTHRRVQFSDQLSSSALLKIALPDLCHEVSTFLLSSLTPLSIIMSRHVLRSSVIGKGYRNHADPQDHSRIQIQIPGRFS